MRSKLFIVLTLLVAAAWVNPAAAQAPQIQRQSIRGTVAKLDGQTLTVKSRDGATIAVALAPHYVVRSLVRKKLSDIHPGDFVGTTSMPGKDGKLHAVEIHFFPANLKLREIQEPWDLAPGAMMTNAHVAGVAKAAHGSVLSINYNNRVTEVIVDRKTAIVAPSPTPASAADLKPGRAVFILATKGADGTPTAVNITVEKNGVKPPM
ncbi:MAG TPA: hypothetical protein VNF99_08905 [Stellaceae bacterium]|nr:hypothetical protein [Stellaceae bacterium]